MPGYSTAVRPNQRRASGRGPERKRGLEEYGLKAERDEIEWVGWQQKKRPMPACANTIEKGKGQDLGGNKGDDACRGPRNGRNTRKQQENKNKKQ